MRLPQSSSLTQHAKQVFLSVVSPFCVGERAFSTRVLGLASEYMQYTVIVNTVLNQKSVTFLQALQTCPYRVFVSSKGEREKETVVV